MRTTEKTTVAAPESETIAKVPAKPAKPAKAEGAGGKGNVHGEASIAQRKAGFQKDAAGLAAALAAMGCNVIVQSSTKGIPFCWRIYGDLVALRSQRDKAKASDKPIARAAIAALESIAAFAGQADNGKIYRFVSLVLYRETKGGFAKVKAGERHPGYVK